MRLIGKEPAHRVVVESARTAARGTTANVWCTHSAHAGSETKDICKAGKLQTHETTLLTLSISVAVVVGAAFEVGVAGDCTRCVPQQSVLGIGPDSRRIGCEDQTRKEQSRSKHTADRTCELAEISDVMRLSYIRNVNAELQTHASEVNEGMLLKLTTEAFITRKWLHVFVGVTICNSFTCLIWPLMLIWMWQNLLRYIAPTLVPMNLSLCRNALPRCSEAAVDQLLLAIHHSVKRQLSKLVSFNSGSLKWPVRRSPRKIMQPMQARRTLSHYSTESL